jgi:acyl carrier protein
LSAIDSHEVRRILSERQIAVPEDDGEEIVLDSLTLAWILDSLTWELDIDLDPGDADVAMFRSVQGIVGYLNAILGAAEHHGR